MPTCVGHVYYLKRINVKSTKLIRSLNSPYFFSILDFHKYKFSAPFYLKGHLKTTQVPQVLDTVITICIFK